MEEKFDPDPRVKRTVHDGREVEAAGHVTFSQEAEKIRRMYATAQLPFSSIPARE